MARPLARQRAMSVEEYLAFEEASPVRHEYVAGELYAMTGATRRHNEIILNIGARLWAAARGGACRVYVAEVKLRAAEDVIYYPDVMVACGPAGDDPLFAGSPCLVVEVLSPSSTVTDRREKLVAYKRLPTLRAYVIVHQERRRVERHWRDEEGAWWTEALEDQGVVPLPCPEMELTLEQVYEGTEPGGS